MKNIFKEEMPSHLYIQNGEISEKAPEKILKEKTPDLSLLDSPYYDNTPPIDSKVTVSLNFFIYSLSTSFSEAVLRLFLPHSYMT